MPFAELSDDGLEHYLAAERERRSEGGGASRRPDVALANHLVMGPVILARPSRAACRTR